MNLRPVFPDGELRAAPHTEIVAISGAQDRVKENGSIVATPFELPDLESLPRRVSLYGNFYFRGYVSGLIGQGGTGKSALVVAEALAMATQRAFSGEIPQQHPAKVWLWNLEDPRDENIRRLAAAMLHFDVKSTELEGNLFVDSGRDQSLVIIKKNRDQITVIEPVVDALVGQIKANSIDVLIIDPFVSSHALPENDNSAIDAAVKAWGRVAGLGNCSVLLVHHSRKLGGEAISAESARGGSAFVDGCRVVRVLARMTDDEAIKLGIEEPRRYFYTLTDKQNLAAYSSQKKWFHLHSVPLPNGDNVGVAAPWTPPDPFATVTTEHVSEVQREFRKRDYRESDQSPDWGGFVVARIMGVDAGEGLRASECDQQQLAERKKVKTILATWQRNGAIEVVQKADEARHKRGFFAVP